jgi:hypothetical protein
MKKIVVLFLFMGISFFNYSSHTRVDEIDLENCICSFSLNAFLTELGHKESTNDYTKVNKWGYVGKYQFSPKTLKALGYEITSQQFLADSSLQEEAVRKLLIANKRVMKETINKFNGKKINGILITESGILAATHLVGPKAVKQYLNSNGKDIKKDALGTSIEDYLEMFKNYTLAI